jgi:hypothetical protein
LLHFAVQLGKWLEVRLLHTLFAGVVDASMLNGMGCGVGICCSSQVQLRTEREQDVTYSAWWSCGDASMLTTSWHL